MKTAKLTSGAVIIFTLINLCMIYIGCRKEISNPYSAENDAPLFRTASNSNAAQTVFDDATIVAEEASLGIVDAPITSSNLELYYTTCAHVTVDLQSPVHLLTVDFGTTDCLGRDGNYRRGQILVSWTGNFHGQGTSHTISFNDYYLNFNKLDGSIVVSDSGQNLLHHRIIGIAINGTLTISPLYDPAGIGGTVGLTANLTKEQIHGGNNPWLNNNDVFLLYGLANGTSLDGTSFSSTINSSNPLKKEARFENFTGGILDVVSGTQAITIDFGYLNGQRDNLASVNLDGQSYIVILDNDGQIIDHH